MGTGSFPGASSFVALCLIVQLFQTSAVNFSVWLKLLWGTSVKPVHVLLNPGLGCGGLLPMFKCSQRRFLEVICYFGALGQELQFG